MSQSRLSRIADALDTINEWTGRTIAWLTLGMVLVTFLVVVLRYVFDLGWIALQEAVTYQHALVFLLGAAYTFKQQGHVRVDIFYQNFTPRQRALVDLLGDLLLLMPVAIFIFWMSWDYVVVSWELRESSPEAGGLPGVFLLKSAMLLMAGLLVIQGITDILRQLQVLGTGETD